MANTTNQWQPREKFPAALALMGLMLLGILLVVDLGLAGKSSNIAQPNKVKAKVESNTPSPVAQGLRASATSPPTATATPTTPVTPTPEPTQLPMQSAEPPEMADMDTATPTVTATPEPNPTPHPTTIVEELPIDHTASKPVVEPMPTPFGTISYTLKVPILMYHYISQPPGDADRYRRDLSVTPENFRQQMAYLAENGYETIDLYDLSLAISGKTELPPKPVIITIDDGYRDNYQNAFPILEEYGHQATFFLATEFIDQGNQNYMDWAMVAEMSAAGHRFEPHSKTHPDLTLHERAYIIWEVQGSRETVAAHIGYMPRYFAYPSGRFNDEVQQILAELDFWGAVTTLGGQWNGYNDRYEWTRMRVRDTTTLEDFISLIE